MRMPKHLFAILASATLLSACADDGRTIGESLEVGGLAAHSWAMLDDDGIVTQVGFSMDRAAAETIAIGVAIPLALPAAAAEQTLFDHIEINFVNEGHQPGPFLVPHFDFHFYTLPTETLLTIDCEAEPMPREDHIPVPYIIPDTAMDPVGTCVPAMGVHAIDPTSPELAPESGTPFSDHFVFGYHDGAIAFLEPMMAQSLLATGAEATGSVPRPAVFGTTTRYPETWSMKLSEDGTEYELSFSNFTDIE